MKVVAPSELVAEAALVVVPCWEEVVVIGAAALQIVLADDLGGQRRDVDVDVVTPTRDVDFGVTTERAAEVVRHLENAGLEPSQEQSERGFTWVRDDLKIQLIRPFHPFPRGAAATIPANPALSLLGNDKHTMLVSFADTPDVPRLSCATPAALIALKEDAFGRSRPNGEPVERDFHDVYLIVDRCAGDLERSYEAAASEVRSGVDRALAALAEGGHATQAAARQHALITDNMDLQENEQAIKRSAIFLARRLASGKS